MASKRTSSGMVDRLSAQSPENIDTIMSFARPGVQPPDFAEISRRMNTLKDSNAESIVWSVMKSVLHPPKDQAKAIKKLIETELTDSEKVMIEIAPTPEDMRRRLVSAMKNGLNDPSKKLPILFMSGLHAAPVMEGTKNPEEVIQHFISGVPLSEATPPSVSGPLSEAEQLSAGSEAASRQMGDLREGSDAGRELSTRMGAAKKLGAAIPQSGAFAGKEAGGVTQDSLMSSLFGSGQMSEPEASAIEASQLYTKKTAKKGNTPETGQLTKKRPAQLFAKAASGKEGSKLLQEVRGSGELSNARYRELLEEAENSVRGLGNPKTLNMGSAVEAFSDIDSKAGSFFKKIKGAGKKGGGKALPLILLALITGALAERGGDEDDA